jgi:ADP-ribose pyrophosphatase YjhB (NUDIX family)
MQIKERVRAILIKDNTALLLIKRVRPERATYWVFPGGGVEAGDASLGAALEREISEELAGSIHIHKLVFVQEQEGEDSITRESFFLCDIRNYNFENKTGSEFTDPSRGEYTLEEVKLTDGELSKRNVQPEEVKQLLLDNLSDLNSLPDLRTGS